MQKSYTVCSRVTFLLSYVIPNSLTKSPTDSITISFSCFHTSHLSIKCSSSSTPPFYTDYSTSPFSLGRSIYQLQPSGLNSLLSASPRSSSASYNQHQNIWPYRQWPTVHVTPSTVAELRWWAFTTNPIFSTCIVCCLVYNNNPW